MTRTLRRTLSTTTRRAVALALVAAAAAPVASVPVRAVSLPPACSGTITVADVRGHSPVECRLAFTGLPVVAEGHFFTDHPQLRSNIHVAVIAERADGSRQDLPIECADYGRPNDPRAQCRVAWDPTKLGTPRVDATALNDVVALVCQAHSHATESRFLNRYFGEDAGGAFACSTGTGEGSARPAAPAFVAVPVNTYVTNPAVVSHTAVRHVDPVYVNTDFNLHDVVALDAVRADGSAPWCRDYDPGRCPLFWSPWIGPGETTTVSGLRDAPPGSYRYYCSLHPDMVATVEVVA